MIILRIKKLLGRNKGRLFMKREAELFKMRSGLEKLTEELFKVELETLDRLDSIQIVLLQILSELKGKPLGSKEIVEATSRLEDKFKIISEEQFYPEPDISDLTTSTNKSTSGITQNLDLDGDVEALRQLGGEDE